MTKVAINFFEVEISKKLINVPYLLYEAKEQVQDLKREFPNGYFQHSNNEIYFWGETNLSPSGSVDLTFAENKNQISKIVREGLLRQFYNDRERFKVYKDFHIYKVILRDSDISNGRFKGLELYKTFNLHFAPLQLGSRTVFGLSISFSISERLVWKVSDFQDAGIQYTDLKVNEETGTILNNPKSKFRLAQHFKYESELKRELDYLNSIQNELKEINWFISTYFKKNKDGFVLPDNLKIAGFKELSFELGQQNEDIKSSVLPKPDLYYYRGKYPIRENSYANRYKISFNKPFTYDEFENKPIKVSVIYPKHTYSDVRWFFKAIEDELINTFKINKKNFEYERFEIDSFELSSYKKAIPLVSRSHPNVVIIVIDKSHEVLEAEESPYFFCKSKFIEHGINTQEIQIQQIQKLLSDKNNGTSNYTDHNLALNIYVKLGGMGWTIKPNEPKNELIIGIGATTDKLGQPILGLTSVFRGDGKYLLGKASSVTDMDSYREGLEGIITSTIENSIKDGTLETDKPFYIIFHIFKPAGKDNEIRALENVVRKFSRYSFEYAFIHIGDGHNYRFFTFEETNQSKKFELKGGLGQNKRGTFVALTDRAGFLCLRTSNSTFAKIKIDSRSSFFDLSYIAEQVYQFAEMSHTSYNKAGIPVTIRYPNLMAYFAEKLKEVNGFYLEEISMPDNSLWFI